MVARSLKTIGTLVMAAALASCSTIDPYAVASYDGTRASVVRNDTTPGLPEAQLNLRVGLAYGDAQVRLWRRKANLSANLQTSIFGAATGALATAGYFGASGDRGASAISALTFAGSGLFGWSALNNARPRQRIYIAGTGALSCLLYTRSALDVTAEEFSSLRSPDGLMSARKQADLARRELVSAARSVIAENGGGTDVTSLVQPFIEASKSAAAELDAADQVLAEASAFLVFLDWNGKNIRYAIDDVIADINAELAKAQLTPEQAIEIASAVGVRARQGIQDVTPTPKEPQGEEQQGAEAEAQGIESLMKRPPISRSSKERQDNLSSAVERLKLLEANLNQQLSALKIASGQLKGIYSPRIRYYGDAAASEVCTPLGGILPLSIDPAATTVQIGLEKEYAVTIEGGSGRYSSSLTGQVTGVTLEATGGVLTGNRVMVKTDGTATGPFGLSIKDLDTKESRDVAFTIKKETEEKKANSSNVVITDLDELDSDEMIFEGRPPVTELFGGASVRRNLTRLTIPGQSCQLTPDQTALVQLAALRTRAYNLSVDGFVDGKWGPLTEQAAKDWLETRARVSLGPDTDVKCALRSTLRRDSQARSKFYSDAETARRRNSEIFAKETELPVCVTARTLSLRSCPGAL